MELPFSESAFLDVFGAYNARWWPVVIALWVVMANLLPILWAAIGSSAAVSLGIRADLALIPAAVLLVIDTLPPRALGPRA